MIYTVTLNPSIDYVVQLDRFTPGEVNRTNEEGFYPGGKGLNVSMVLKQLGRESVALGFIAGFTGEQIEQAVKERGVKTDFIRLGQGVSRVNVKIKTGLENDIQMQESEINATGPRIEKHHIQSFLTKLERIQSGDIIVLAGSLPKGMDSNLYRVICETLRFKGVRVIVDASGEVLKHAVFGKPFLVKPNINELEQLLEKKIQTEEELTAAGKILLEMGAEHVLISCGKDGAVFMDGQQIIRQKTVKKAVCSTVGCGDSLVAGFLDGWLRLRNWKSALREGVAAGSAGAFCAGLADKEQIMALMEELDGLSG